MGIENLLFLHGNTTSGSIKIGMDTRRFLFPLVLAVPEDDFAAESVAPIYVTESATFMASI